jgi:hypothetical protein
MATWRDIDGWPGYQVDIDGGRVRSLDRTLPNGQFCAGKVLRQTRDTRGYYRVTLRDGKRVKTVRVHVLVMEASAGKRPAGLHILHKRDRKNRNGRKWLRYGTAQENEREKRERIKEKEKNREGYRKGTPRGTSAGTGGYTP